MNEDKLMPIHPGEVLLEEFIKPMNLSQNQIALALFLGQAMTGSRDLLEIPLSWQKPAIYRCDFANKTCPEPKSSTPLIDPIS